MEKHRMARREQGFNGGFLKLQMERAAEAPLKKQNRMNFFWYYYWTFFNIRIHMM